MTIIATKPAPGAWTSFPESGQIIDVATDIGWMRLPLPLHLNHVNIWILDDGDGWTLIDCGANTPDTRQLWESAIAGPLASKPVHRMVATHGHIDHVGFAGPLNDLLGNPEFRMTRVEWLSASLRAAERSEAESEAASRRFFRAHGFPQDEVDSVSQRAFSLDLLRPLPPFVRMIQGETLRMGGRDWEVMIAGGHAPEHASFYCRDSRILIVGDQILSPITPVIAVFPQEPDADPLGDYLASLPVFRALPEDTLVLPSHGVPFTGLHARIDVLRQHHETRLVRTCEAAGAGATAYEVALAYFPKAMKDGRRRLAFAETLAHLRYAANAGMLRSWRDGATIYFGQS